MAFNAKAAGGGGGKVEQPVIDPGVYPARLVQLIDMGVQQQRAFQGTAKPPIQEIMFTYELVDVFMLDEDGEEIEDKPRWVSETLPFHNLRADKAKSTQRYNAFDPKMDWDGDISKAVGEPINVVLVNNEKDGKTYTNVASVAAMTPKARAKCPELVNPTTVFSLDEPDMEVFNKLPEWIRDKIKKNLGFNGSPLEKLLKGEGAPAKGKPKADKPPVEEEENDEDNNPY